MNDKKAEMIVKIYNVMRWVLIAALLMYLFVGLSEAEAAVRSVAELEPLTTEQCGTAEDMEARTTALEQKMQTLAATKKYMPQIHGILRGKFEYQPDMKASRFEVRNARLSACGELPMRSAYKLEVDLCDESSIKMKDAWVRVNPWRTLRLTVGQQRMPFSIDAHRNPSAQFFANRSFIAKQVGDMRDVGVLAGYDFMNGARRKVLSIEGGIFNGSNLDEQKTAWFKSPGYSARLQWFPLKGLALIPSVQHQVIANREASYLSLDFGAYYEVGGWHVEAEYLRKTYADDAFADCSALDAMVIYSQPLRRENSYVEQISYQARYDYMQDHSSGKAGFEKDAAGNATSRLALTDAERHRMTLGVTLRVRNPYFPTDIRFNYEKYWYPHGGAKESEQDKVVCEMVIRF